MRVAVVGAGPAGLYFSRLLGQSQPDAEIAVFERSHENATWGFGVALGGRSMAAIAAADQEVHDSLVAAMRFGSEHAIRLNEEVLELRYAEPTGAIARLELLRILIAACRRVGVILHFSTNIDSADQLAGYDLIVAADGASSALRAEHEQEFGTVRLTLTNRFAWYGVAQPLPMGLVFRSFENGTFVGHHYAYSPSMSTFVAECDASTWHRFGLETKSDYERKALIERVFAPELQGNALVANNSVWRRFPAISTARYHHQRTVLIGDSLRVAHFSIGSGTRLALEDAAALHSAVAKRPGDISEALISFERARRPARDTFAEAARLSFEWYEGVAEHMRQPLLPFVHAFLTRTGRIDEPRLRTYAPSFHEAYQHYRQCALN